MGACTPIRFDVPAGACDCHTHIHGDPERFPYFAGRVYTPPAALPEEMAVLHRTLGIQRVVIVTPSVYGTDNSATLWGMKVRGADARGVAVIDAHSLDEELDAMDRAGIRGMRLNLATGGKSDPTAARRTFEVAAARMQRRGWHIQIFTNLQVISSIRDLVAVAPVPVVFDHFGGALANQGTEQAGFAALLDLVASGRAYVKISGAYRASGLAPDYPDAAPLARALVAANPDRVVWGTDWPHPDSSSGRAAHEVTPFLDIDDGRLLNQLAVWVPDSGTRRRILVDNPARLYGF